MKTKQQLLKHSVVTLVTTGLTLLSSGTTQAHDRGNSGMRMGGAGGSISNGAFHQSIGTGAFSRGAGMNDVAGRNRTDNRDLALGRDDRGGRGEREPGDDHGRRHREPGDDKGGKGNSIMISEREPGNDHGRGHHREPGDL